MIFVAAFLLAYAVTRFAYKYLRFDPDQVSAVVPGWLVDFAIWVVVFCTCYWLVAFIWRRAISPLLERFRA
ncbi:MAG: hypothetical protein ACR2GP_03435 [Burkholderiaceae bacterium]